MNKQQQELYEKLLKKVNEYCLGQAAEDVIAAIDALLDTYESKTTNMDLDDALNVIYNSQDIMGGYDEFWKAYRTIEAELKEKEEIDNAIAYGGGIYAVNGIIGKQLKALEIIYTKEVDINWLTLQFEGADIKDVIEYVENYPTMCSDKPLTADEVTLLKEIYDDILQVQKR